MTRIGTTLRLMDTYSAVRERYAPVGVPNATNVQQAIDNLAATVAVAATKPPNLTRKTITAAMSPYALLPDDYYLEIDVSGGPVTINTGLAAARANLPAILKHVAGNAAANNITVNSAGGETFDNLASPILIDFNGGGFNLQPKTGGWELTP